MAENYPGLVRCLEGLFDTWGVFGQGFNNNLTLGGPTPIGARKANLSQEVASHLAEVALNEQVGSSIFACELYRDALLYRCHLTVVNLLVHH